MAESSHISIGIFLIVASAAVVLSFVGVVSAAEVAAPAPSPTSGASTITASIFVVFLASFVALFVGSLRQWWRRGIPMGDGLLQHGIYLSSRLAVLLLVVGSVFSCKDIIIFVICCFFAVYHY